MKKFEYKIINTEVEGFFGGKVDDYYLSEELNELGLEGWELVAMVL